MKTTISIVSTIAILKYLLQNFETIIIVGKFVFLFVYHSFYLCMKKRLFMHHFLTLPAACQGKKFDRFFRLLCLPCLPPPLRWMNIRPNFTAIHSMLSWLSKGNAQSFPLPSPLSRDGRRLHFNQRSYYSRLSVFLPPPPQGFSASSNGAAKRSPGRDGIMQACMTTQSAIHGRFLETIQLILRLSFISSARFLLATVPWRWNHHHALCRGRGGGGRRGASLSPAIWLARNVHFWYFCLERISFDLSCLLALAQSIKKLRSLPAIFSCQKRLYFKKVSSRHLKWRENFATIIRKNSH